jgi:ribose transport system substrate-binding protein
MGWQATVCDGKGDTNTMLNCIRQGIAAKVNGIFMIYIDCPTVKAALQQAHAAGIKLVADESYDCNQISAGAPSLYDYVVSYGGQGHGMDFPTFLYHWGQAQAVWDIVKNNGHAHVIDFLETDARTDFDVDRAIHKQIATCPGCSIVDTVDFTAPDLGPALQQKAQEAFLTHPDFNATTVSNDGTITSGAGAAIRASGRRSQIHIMGGECEPPNLQLIRSGGPQDACVPLLTSWEGIAAMDGLNRLFHGAKVSNSMPTGMGLTVIDKEHNLPPSGVYASPINVHAAYLKAWGITG